MLEFDTLSNLYFKPESTLTIKTILTLYICFNAFRIFSYIPQMITLYKEKSSARAISLLTYWMWTGANFTTAVYASVITVDWWLACISYMNSICCTIICLMIHYKRSKYDNPLFKLTEIKFAQDKETTLTQSH